GNGIRTERVLNPLGKWLIISIEHAQILDHVRKVLNTAIVKVISAPGSRKAGRAISQEGGNSSRTAGRHLLIRETHPHRRLGIDTACERKPILVGNFARQPNLD